MAKINTKESLISYIRRKLGEPILRVELTDDHLDDIIDEVITKFSEFAYDGQDIRHMLIPIFSGVKEYKLDSRISSVMNLKVKRTGVQFNIIEGFSIPAGYNVVSSNLADTLKVSDFETTLAKMSYYDYLFDLVPNYSFNSNNKLLVFHEDMSAYDKAIIEVALEYEPASNDMIFNHPWIKDMCVAEAKIQWGTNTGKYSGSLINGMSINYENIKSDGKEDRDRLNEELLSRWSPPLGVVVG